MDEFISDFVFLIEQKLAQHGVRLEREETGSFPALLANAQKLKQALLNLVMNAVEAMPNGGTLKLSMGERSGRFEIIVADTGKGIPAGRLGTVFDPFYSTKTNGLGLGLAVCREIIEQHKGSLSVESREGVGTTFFVRLPI